MALQCELQKVSAIILAGGKGQRVGFKQKALLNYHGKPMIEAILAILSPQLAKDKVWINANQSLEVYRSYCLNVFQDIEQGFLGPLAGMLSAWQFVNSDWLVFVPCDNPNLPNVLVERLIRVQLESKMPLIVTYDGERLQPLYCLMHRSMQKSLSTAIEKKHLSVWRWIKENPHALADYADCCPENFQNLNSL